MVLIGVNMLIVMPIKGCSQANVPTWAYLIITARLTKYAKNIYYGDVRSAIKVS